MPEPPREPPSPGERETFPHASACFIPTEKGHVRGLRVPTRLGVDAGGREISQDIVYDLAGLHSRGIPNALTTGESIVPRARDGGETIVTGGLCLELSRSSEVVSLRQHIRFEPYQSNDGVARFFIVVNGNEQLGVLRPGEMTQLYVNQHRASGTPASGFGLMTDGRGRIYLVDFRSLGSQVGNMKILTPQNEVVAQISGQAEGGEVRAPDVAPSPEVPSTQNLDRIVQITTTDGASSVVVPLFHHENGRQIASSTLTLDGYGGPYSGIQPYDTGGKEGVEVAQGVCVRRDDDVFVLENGSHARVDAIAIAPHDSSPVALQKDAWTYIPYTEEEEAILSVDANDIKIETSEDGMTATVHILGHDFVVPVNQPIAFGRARRDDFGDNQIVIPDGGRGDQDPSRAFSRRHGTFVILPGGGFLIRYGSTLNETSVRYEKKDRGEHTRERVKSAEHISLSECIGYHVRTSSAHGKEHRGEPQDRVEFIPHYTTSGEIDGVVAVVLDGSGGSGCHDDLTVMLDGALEGIRQSPSSDALVCLRQLHETSLRINRARGKNTCATGLVLCINEFGIQFAGCGDVSAVCWNGVPYEHNRAGWYSREPRDMQQHPGIFRLLTPVKNNAHLLYEAGVDLHMPGGEPVTTGVLGMAPHSNEIAHAIGADDSEKGMWSWPVGWPYPDIARAQYLIVGSDGSYAYSQLLKPEQDPRYPLAGRVSDVLRQLREGRLTLNQAAETCTRLAQEAGSGDDITYMILDLEKLRTLFPPLQYIEAQAA